MACAGMASRIARKQRFARMLTATPRLTAVSMNRPLALQAITPAAAFRRGVLLNRAFATRLARLVHAEVESEPVETRSTAH